ncbi:UNVERIFIED_CONTAM: hypothetical protein K2H54_051702 [Gekko kuhli]
MDWILWGCNGALARPQRGGRRCSAPMAALLTSHPGPGGTEAGGHGGDGAGPEHRGSRAGLQDARPHVAMATKEVQACMVPAAATTGSQRPGPAEEARARPAAEKEAALGIPPPPATDQLARAATVDPRRMCGNAAADGGEVLARLAPPSSHMIHCPPAVIAVATEPCPRPAETREEAWRHPPPHPMPQLGLAGTAPPN